MEGEYREEVEGKSEDRFCGHVWWSGLLRETSGARQDTRS